METTVTTPKLNKEEEKSLLLMLRMNDNKAENAEALRIFGELHKLQGEIAMLKKNPDTDSRSIRGAKEEKLEEQLKSLQGILVTWI